uniref:Uncharacterized protein n=1 Tax=Arion vulgaris TaxID=1028688 RepID=A0A0B7BBC0_9EUPU
MENKYRDRGFERRFLSGILLGGNLDVSLLHDVEAYVPGCNLFTFLAKTHKEWLT